MSDTATSKSVGRRGRTSTSRITTKADPKRITAEVEVNGQKVTIKSGDFVQPGTPLPQGWQYIPIEGGGGQAWPTAEQAKGHPVSIDIRATTLKALDEHWDRHAQTTKHPNLPMPSAVCINKAFAKLFRVQREFRGAPFVVRADGEFDGPKWEPQFFLAFDDADNDDLWTDDDDDI